MEYIFFSGVHGTFSRRDVRPQVSINFILFFLKIYLLFAYLFLFIFGCVGSQLQHAGSSLRYVGSWLRHVGFLFSSCGVQAPEGMGSVVCGMRALYLRHVSSVVVVHGLSCAAACGILVP